MKIDGNGIVMLSAQELQILRRAKEHGILSMVKAAEKIAEEMLFMQNNFHRDYKGEFEQEQLEWSPQR